MTWIIDIEASGLHPESYPIEIGLYNIDTGEEYSSLIKPFSSWVYWDPNAELIHGISREQLEAEGKDPVTVCEEIHKMVYSSYDIWVYSDASWFDQAWYITLIDSSGATGVEGEFGFSDVHSLIPDSTLWDFRKGLQTMKKPHRALADTKLLGELVKKYR